MPTPRRVVTTVAPKARNVSAPNWFNAPLIAVNKGNQISKDIHNVFTNYIVPDIINIVKPKPVTTRVYNTGNGRTIQFSGIMPTIGPAGIVEDVGVNAAIDAAEEGASVLEDNAASVGEDAGTQSSVQSAVQTMKNVGNAASNAITSLPGKILIGGAAIAGSGYLFDVGTTGAGQGIANLGTDIGQAAYNAEQGIITGIGLPQNYNSPYASPSSSGTPSSNSSSGGILSDLEPIAVIAVIALIAYAALTHK